MADDFTDRLGDLLLGSYDCVDRIVLNAYNTVCYSAGGFRHWWRQLYGCDADLDNTHLIRLAGRFSRRLRAYASAHHIPVVDCRRGERKHEIAEAYLADHPLTRGLFLILVARAVAPIWDVERSTTGTIRNLSSKKPYVNHYSFHIVDPDWGHITIKMAGHPPFGAQIILNGHEYVACQASRAAVEFAKEGNCFTYITDAAGLARVADTLSESGTIGRLTQVCERWIYSTCLCFALDREEQRGSGFRYQYSVYQLEYSRNLLFRVGGQMEQLFQRLIDRTRVRLTVPWLRTLFGAKARPRRNHHHRRPRLEVVVETLQYGVTVFKINFSKLTLKGYTKGERVLRFEAIVHNTRDLGCGRVVANFPRIVTRLAGILQRFLSTLHCIDCAFLPDGTLDELPLASRVGRCHVGGVDPNKPRMRQAMAAVLALAPSPGGFTVGQFAAHVRSLSRQTSGEYGTARAAYDLKKLRGKDLVHKVGFSRRYQASSAALRTMAALLVLRDHVITPILSGVRSPRRGRKPAAWSAIDADYERLRLDMQQLFAHVGIAA